MSWRRYQAIDSDGFDFSTGRQTQSVSADELALQARKLGINPVTHDDLINKYRRSRDGELRPAPWVNSSRLDESGWAIVFPHDVDPDIPKALQPLIALRKSAISNPKLFRKLVYRKNESKEGFLIRHGMAETCVDPQILPYFVLLVGQPSDIPFDFQCHLGLQFAVGRVAFDHLDDYHRYAEKVVRVEKEQRQRPSQPIRTLVFAPQHRSDGATGKGRLLLAEPLAAFLGRKKGSSSVEVEQLFARLASRAAFIEQLKRSDLDLIITISHGISSAGEYDKELVGALLCSDWQSNGKSGPISRGCLLKGTDLTELESTSRVFLCVACFGAGLAADERERSVDLVADLPKKLLGGRNGALAFVGSIGQTWTSLFTGPQAQSQITVFQSMIWQLLQGLPVGSALEEMRARWSELAVGLAEVGRRSKFENGSAPSPSPVELAALWTAYNDVRSYVILGDPFVKLGNNQGEA